MSEVLLRTEGGCDLDAGHLLEVFGEQRRRFVAVLREFGPGEWAAPTRCAGWSAHDVVRHLCDGTPAIAADVDDRTFDLAAGFDPRTTPRRWMAASADEPPGATLDRLEAMTEDALTAAHDRVARGRRFEIPLPYGRKADWTVLTLHIFWDSWIHERDVLLARGAEHPTGGDATGYAAAYGLFLAAAVARLFGHRVRQRLELGGRGGGVFDLDDRGAVTLTATLGVALGGPVAAEVVDALAGRTEVTAVLGELPAGVRTALTCLAAFFNAPG